MCIALAIGAGAVVGAVGSAVAGSEAAGATKDASRAAIDQQNKALTEQGQLSQPYRDLGQAEIPTLKNLLGIGGADPTKALEATPGYQFAKGQGLQATTNQASAMGLGLSGNMLQGLDKFSTGLADQTYQSAVGNAENVVNTGQAAAAGQAANVGNAAGNISSTLVNQGNTLAGIDANTAAGISKSIGNAGNQYITATTLAGLQNPGGGGGGGGLYTAPDGYTTNTPGGP